VNRGVAGSGPRRISQPAWLVVAVAFLLPWGGLGVDYALRWTPLQRQYLGAYLWSGSLPGHSRYTFLTVVSPRGNKKAHEPGVNRHYASDFAARIEAHEERVG